MSIAIRALYVIIVAVSYIASVFLLQIHELLFITLLIFGLIAVLMSSIPIQIEMNKRREPPSLPVFILVLPTLLYFWGTGSFDVMTESFLHFFAMLLYFVNVGGFMFGMLLSPVMAKHRGQRDPRVAQKVKGGKAQIRKSGFIPFMIFLFVGVMITLVFAALTLYEQMQLFGSVQQVFAILALLVALYLIIRLTYRSSIWGDPQQYGFYDSQIMKDYFNLARKTEDEPPHENE